MTNETLETIKSRRSCRAYKPEQITDEELNAVLEAGTYAASAMGRQSATNASKSIFSPIFGILPKSSFV